jgi:UDP-N-acetylmuramate dehydrogenase
MNLNLEIQKIDGCDFKANEDLTTYTTMRLTSQGDLVIVKSVEALQKLLPLLNQHQRKYLVVGWGANQILPAKCEYLVIHLDLPFDPAYLDSEHETYSLPASLGLNHLTAHAVKFNLKGWEVFTGIPASLGGAIYMNAGTNLGEMGKLVKSVTLVTTTGAVRTEIMTPESFAYRKNHFTKVGEVIVGAELFSLGKDEKIAPTIRQYLDYRKNSQPLTTKNCGCVFKNPSRETPAGKLIDLIGLKGIQLGGLRISTKHGNFIENVGAADWDEFRTLVEVIKYQMDHFYGIEFELEVKIPYH